MSNAILQPPTPENEPVLGYAPGSAERDALEAAVRKMLGEPIEIPLIIGGRPVRTGRLGECRIPHDHGHVLARYHKAGPKEVELAIAASQDAWHAWSRLPWQERAAVFLRAADLLAGPFRQTLNAATVLGQSKTPHQAEIDAAAELVDFFRFNVQFMRQLYAEQPRSAPGAWNRLEHRPLEGFVFAATPFNFTSIAGNLPSAPALMGNTVLWKPASTAVTSAWHVMRLLEAAGLPPGVINFLPGDGSAVGRPVLAHPDLAGIHFTGSTGVFQSLWRQVAEGIAHYRSYPRVVGETGGKGFIFAHPSADPAALRTAITRGAFEYQGQKCSAASRLYLPESLWATLREPLVEEIRSLRVGDPMDPATFVAAVIDEKAFGSIGAYVDHARASDDIEILTGGERDDRQGWFIQPTLVRSRTPDSRLMQEEIFGPVVTAYVYPDAEYEQALGLCDRTSPYALTGAVFARDRLAIATAADRLRHAAGNFYINDKPTGAVVGQQPFGGGRASGTNDKAGSPLNLLRWISARAIKETFVPPTDFRYPYMG